MQVCSKLRAQGLVGCSTIQLLVAQQNDISTGAESNGSSTLHPSSTNSVYPRSWSGCSSQNPQPVVCQEESRNERMIVLLGWLRALGKHGPDVWFYNILILTKIASPFYCEGKSREMILTRTTADKMRTITLVPIAIQSINPQLYTIFAFEVLKSRSLPC
jgi:hypothetical protein